MRGVTLFPWHISDSPYQHLQRALYIVRGRLRITERKPNNFAMRIVVLEYVISLVQRHVSEKMEKAVFALLASHQYSTIASEELSWHQATMQNQILVRNCSLLEYRGVRFFSL